MAEKVIQKAVLESGANAKILRIGQIVPSHKTHSSKLWNVNEVLPLIIRSAGVMGVLPNRTSSGDGCRWLGVDVVANVMLDLCLPEQQANEAGHLLYNIVHPRTFSWKKIFLPKLKEAGMEFNTVGYEDWIVLLRKNKEDVAKKLLGALGEMDDGIVDVQDGSGVLFDTTSAEALCPSFKDARTSVEGDLVLQMIRAWREAW